MNALFNYQYSMKIFLFFSILFFSTLSLPNSVKSSDILPYGRYLTLHLQPSVEQSNILSAMIQVHFSPAIHTVGDAIIHSF